MANRSRARPIHLAWDNGRDGDDDRAFGNQAECIRIVITGKDRR